MSSPREVPARPRGRPPAGRRAVLEKPLTWTASYDRDHLARNKAGGQLVITRLNVASIYVLDKEFLCEQARVSKKEYARAAGRLLLAFRARPRRRVHRDLTGTARSAASRRRNGREDRRARQQGCGGRPRLHHRRRPRRSRRDSGSAASATSSQSRRITSTAPTWPLASPSGTRSASWGKDPSPTSPSGTGSQPAGSQTIETPGAPGHSSRLGQVAAPGSAPWFDVIRRPRSRTTGSLGASRMWSDRTSWSDL